MEKQRLRGADGWVSSASGRGTRRPYFTERRDEANAYSVYYSCAAANDHASASRAYSGDSGKPDTCSYSCADSEAETKTIAQAEAEIRGERVGDESR